MPINVDPSGPVESVYTTSEVDALVAAGGGLDAEAVRDAIGLALVGGGLISIVVNDAADTITISTAATQNSTDAALRDRSTHTGTQSVSTLSATGTPNSSTFLRGDGTWATPPSGSTLADNSVTNAKMADAAVGIPELSATGTPSSATFLRGDNTWAAPPVSGGTAAYTVINLTQAPYNADPTGVTDIAPIVLSAINNNQGKVRIFLPEGTYKWNSSVSSGYPTYLFGAGVGRTVINHNPQVTMLQCIGFEQTQYSLASNIASGANTINLATTSGLVAGDVLNIRSLKVWPGSEPTPTGSGKGARFGELVEVASVSGSTVTLTGLTAYSYAVADTVTIWKLSMINGFRVEDMTIRNSAPNTGGNSILTMRRVRNAAFRDLEFQYQDGPSIEGYMVWGLNADNVTFRNGSEQGSNGRLAYGFDMRDACRDWSVSNCKMFGGRHLFTTNAYGAGTTLCYGIPRGATVTGCIGTDGYEAPFDTHEEGDDVVLVGCKVLSSRAFAFQVRAPRTKLIGCSSSGMQVGVMVRKSATDFEIHNYTALDVKAGGAGNPAGVQIDDNGPSGGIIDGLNVSGADHAAVLVQSGAQPLVIRNVVARNIGRTAGNGAIEFVGTSSGHALQSIVSFGTTKPLVFGPSTVTGVTGDGLRPRGAAVSGGGITLT